MLVVAGIDEAGFGPLLGPLVVSAAAFRVPEARADACLWDVLRESCAARPARRDHRLVVGDSKQVYRGGDGLPLLERTALVMLEAAGYRPRRWSELLTTLAPGLFDALAHHPWYADGDLPLPVCDATGDIATRASALKSDCRAQQIEFLGAWSEPVLEREYNRIVAATDNKSSVVLQRVLRLVQTAVGLSCNCTKVAVDRLGGRTHYREALMGAFPDWCMHVLDERDECSAYRLTRGERTLEVTFQQDGESHHLPVALASMYSKYLRELFMHRFNTYFSQRQPGLEPTAGYYTDALRWLRDADALLRRLGIDQAQIVRSR